MSEKIEYCEVCESIGTLIRKPSMFFNAKKKSKQGVGARVKEFIDDARNDLQRQKEELENTK